LSDVGVRTAREAVREPGRPGPARTARRFRIPCAVAVVGDGSTPDRDPPRRPGSVDSVLGRWTELIHQHTGVASRPVCVSARDAEGLSAGLRGLPSAIGAFVVIRTDLAHYAAAGGGDRPVVADRSTAAAAVTAALLTTLSRRGIPPPRCRLVIAGATAMPALGPLLATAGFGGITSWDRHDAGRFPLHRIAGNAEVVIDLLGCGRELAAAAGVHPQLIILTPDPASWALLALPGLLRAVAAAEHPRLDLGVYSACALALALATPPGRVLPDPADPAPAGAVERAAARALRCARPRPGPAAAPAPGSPRRTRARPSGSREVGR
jgi:hypothetical protein